MKNHRESAPPELNIVIDGRILDDIPTDIDENFTGEDMEEGIAYNMLGLPVNPTCRYLVIRNGKEIIIG